MQITFRRQPCFTDLATVQRLVAASSFFSDAEVKVAVELVEDRLVKGRASSYEFVFAARGDEVLGYTCFGSIPCTQSSYDLYWIVVDPDYQGQGIGKTLLECSETLIRAQGGRRVYIETSAREQYAPTCAFYHRRGYRQEALLEDFYAPGDGKLIYCKVLESVSLS
jgi:ribosomal protein S18 acetylase RimI-like enzyme